jgi:small subunit ribosomal protein S18
MDTSSQNEGGAPEGRGRFRPRRKVCYFCTNGVKHVDYKNIDLMRSYIDGSRIKARKKTGACGKHQRHIARAIKRARYMALFPFVENPS